MVKVKEGTDKHLLSNYIWNNTKQKIRQEFTERVVFLSGSNNQCQT